MKLSVITVCYQAEKELERTLSSLLLQEKPDCEVESVIVDGGSRDGTAEVVKKFAPLLENAGMGVRFKSEKDGGIYDAMNKGVSRAEGEWCVFLNAGDEFFNSQSLKILTSGITANCDVVYGDTVRCYGGKYDLSCARAENEIDFKSGMEFCHQSCVIRTQVLRERPYSTEYKIASDYDFFADIFVSGKKFRYQKGKIAVFMLDGVSVKNGSLLQLEYAQIQRKYNLIDEKTYKKAVKKAKYKLFFRKILPKKWVWIRHERIMEKVSENWTEDKAKIR